MVRAVALSVVRPSACCSLEIEHHGRGCAGHASPARNATFTSAFCPLLARTANPPRAARSVRPVRRCAVQALRWEPASPGSAIDVSRETSTRELAAGRRGDMGVTGPGSTCRRVVHTSERWLSGAESGSCTPAPVRGKELHLISAAPVAHLAGSARLLQPRGAVSVDGHRRTGAVLRGRHTHGHAGAAG
jgi:hypothetical protein